MFIDVAEQVVVMDTTVGVADEQTSDAAVENKPGYIIFR